MCGSILLDHHMCPQQRTHTGKFHLPGEPSVCMLTLQGCSLSKLLVAQKGTADEVMLHLAGTLLARSW